MNKETDNFDKNNVKDNNESILIEAVKSKCSLETVISMLEEGVDVNFKDKKGRTALIHAALLRNQKIIESLIEAGVDIDSRHILF